MLIAEPMMVEGAIRAWERPTGSRVWRPCWSAKNIVLNSFYNDLFAEMASGATPSKLQVGALALGYGNAPTFARTDTGLAAEWNNPATTLSAQLTSGTAYTALTVPAIAMTIPSGTSIQLGAAGQTVTTSAQANPGATSIPVTSFTASQTYTVGTAVNVLSWTPQRMSPTLTNAGTTDPPQMTWSFYLAASANTVSLAFTEAALLYNSPSLSSGGAGSWLTHVAFTYTKPINTDVRIDYVLQRSLT